MKRTVMILLALFALVVCANCERHPWDGVDPDSVSGVNLGPEYDEALRVCCYVAEHHSGGKIEHDKYAAWELKEMIETGDHLYTHCGTIGLVAIDLLRIAQYNVRLISMTHSTEYHGHQQFELEVDGGWAFIDVFSDVIPVTPTGDPMSLWDLVEAIASDEPWGLVWLEDDSWHSDEQARKALEICACVPIVYEWDGQSWRHGYYPVELTDAAWYALWIEELAANWLPLPLEEWLDRFYGDSLE